MLKKNRVLVREDVAAEILFLHDHTCCVCREKGKSIQIHHIDEDPSNNVADNLTILCLQDHNDTQASGGFGRKLGSSEVRKYRDDWLERVKNRRERADKLAVERMGGVNLKTPVNVTWKRPSQQELNAYIQNLPELLRAAFAAAWPEWDCGVNSRMKIATGELVDFAQRVLVYLANWFPPDHFDGKDAEVYFEEFIAGRYLYHRAVNEPNGPGTGGTIVGLLAASGALGDVLKAISDLVAVQAPGQFDFSEWHERWEKAQQRPEEAKPA